MRTTLLAPLLSLILITSVLAAEHEHSQNTGASMSTKNTVEGYFIALKQGKGWETFLSDDGMMFTSFTSPVKQVTGKAAYLEATKRFYTMIISVQVRDLIVEADKACALNSYELQPPAGNRFTSDVAEIFTVRNGKIDSLAIYFDRSPFPK